MSDIDSVASLREMEGRVDGTLPSLENGGQTGFQGNCLSSVSQLISNTRLLNQKGL